MSHDDALDALASHPHVDHFRRLCAEANPDVEQRDAIRAQVIRLAVGEPLRSVDAILAEAKAEDIPSATPPRRGCCP